MTLFLAMHPFPREPEARGRAEHEHRRREEHARAEEAVEHVADREARERGQHDGPAENADLPEPVAERRLGLRAAARLALGCVARGPRHVIGLV